MGRMKDFYNNTHCGHPSKSFMVSAARVLLVVVVLILTKTSTSTAGFSNVTTMEFDEGYTQLFGDQNLVRFSNGRGVKLILDIYTGSGFKSTDAYYHGLFSASIKLPTAAYTAGVVVAFYVSNGDIFKRTHDEIDFEFLGNIKGKPWKVQTNVYGSGSTRRGREERYILPFDPSQDLFLKGLEIFGRNSCLVARNLLSGLKTCTEVHRHMFHDCDTMLNRLTMKNKSSRNNNTDPDYMKEMPTRARIWRRRGRTRKLKYTWKSAGYPSIRKRIADGKERCKKYVPCGCQQMCGKDCSCHKNGTCCEKYCGCSKSCKNRFRGCHCAKSQCMSRQCPCFAAGRECDPDVCRNCWVSCGGDAALGEPAEPPPRGDDYQCGNMKLLLRQQEKILLGKSDVAGWGAFIKNPVNKHTYLGEYTGELISHKEADKRGKIYDRSNSSFLFDLNDEYVLDAYRKGDKLKFANHSSNPNCYAKIMLVSGDHRVGIYANERIEASEELFYDYRYGDNEAPAWARKPEGSKKEDSSSHNNKRAYKIA